MKMTFSQTLHVYYYGDASLRNALLCTVPPIPSLTFVAFGQTAFVKHWSQGFYPYIELYIAESTSRAREGQSLMTTTI